jgi:hypothetical protein
METPAPKDLLPSKRKKVEEAEEARRALALKEAVRQVLGEEAERYVP